MHKYLLFIVQLLVIIALMMFLGFLVSMFFPAYVIALIIGFGVIGFFVPILFSIAYFDQTQEIMRRIIKYTFIGELLLQLILSIPS